MRLSTGSMVALGSAAGLLAAVAGFQSVSLVNTSSDGAAETPDPSPEVVVSYLPCDDGATLQDGVCVKVKNNVVVIEDSTPAADDSGTDPVPPATHDDDDSDFDEDFDDDFDEDFDEDSDEDEAEDHAEDSDEDEAEDHAEDESDDLGDDHGGDRSEVEDDD